MNPSPAPLDAKKAASESPVSGTCRRPGPAAVQGAAGDTAKRRKRKESGPSPKGGSREARRLASVILEVLAGQRTPSEAAEAAGISTSRYYLMESRSLEGMILACEPRKKGYVKTPERMLEAMQEEQVRLKRECVRLHALVRAAQRSIGLSLPVSGRDGKEKKGEQKGKRRKWKRRPVMRALQAVRKLQQEAAGTAAADPAARQEAADRDPM